MGQRFRKYWCTSEEIDIEMLNSGLIVIVNGRIVNGSNFYLFSKICPFERIIEKEEERRVREREQETRGLSSDSTATWPQQPGLARLRQAASTFFQVAREGGWSLKMLGDFFILNHFPFYWMVVFIFTEMLWEVKSYSKTVFST